MAAMLAQDLVPSNDDIINILGAAPRDFLAETKEYHGVVLHCIFHVPVFYGNTQFETDSCTKVSRLHSATNWRERLMQTEAKWIVVFNHYPACLDYNALGDLDNYKATVDRIAQHVLYTKQ